MKKQCYNPYLPSWEFIPDGEPHVYNGRVYIYGSHDSAHGYVFCQNDYVCWSAPENDLSDWRYEGVIFGKTDDPINADGRMCLYAPDVTVGPDGRYYLYYVYDKINIVSVAVCDTPAGKYEFLGYVRHADGTRLGEAPGDEPQFDPAVLTEGDKTYLYTGFAWADDKSRTGSRVAVLGSDMLTVIQEPVTVVPSGSYGKGTSFEGHEFFEASSIRKRGDMYYFIYSSVAMNELCYATSKDPTKDFVYRGVIVSNCDLGIDTYKPAKKHIYPAGNNHGSIVEINGSWYVFYHRQTNGTWFSRQGCVEPIEICENGLIKQVEITSQGANKAPLVGKGEYPSYIACNIFRTDDKTEPMPKITKDGCDDDETHCHIADISDNTAVGFKYFDCKGIKKVSLKTRGYCNGTFELRLKPEGAALGSIRVENENIWTWFSSDITIPDGVHSLYFVYTGSGTPSFAAFLLE